MNTCAAIVVPSPVERYLLHVYMDAHDNITQCKAAQKELGRFALLLMSSTCMPSMLVLYCCDARVLFVNVLVMPH